MTNVGFTAASGRDQFLKLLVAQLQHQNPLEPVGQQEFLGQLAQFSVVDGIEKLNAQFSELIKAQDLSKGVSFIGRTVTFAPAEGVAAQSGVVDAVRVSQGRILLQLGDHEVTLDEVQSVAA